MTTADRTPIRRWLAIGGGAHRPPWGARKTRHRSIVAPLAATLAAGAAVGLGVVVARAGSERRGRNRWLRERRLGLAPGEPLGPGLQRMALAQADLALAQLADDDPARVAETVHETRKAIKRMRTIVRLLESELGEQSSAREHDALRRAAECLAGARDAAVMLQTLQELVQRHPRGLAGKKSLARLRARLAGERDVAELRAADPAQRARAAAELQSFRLHAAAWTLPAGDELALLEGGLRDIYRQGRRRGRQAGRRHGGRPATMHRWRKRVKDLRYAAEAMRPLRRGGRQASAARSGWFAKLAKQAEELGELLGDDHDLAVLAERLRQPDIDEIVSRKTRRKLLRLIKRRRAKLRRRALKAGARLYARPGGRFARRAVRAHRRRARLS